MPKAIKQYPEKKTKKEEGINETVTDLREKIKERQRTFVYSASAFVLVILAVFGYVVYNSTTKSKALDLELQAYKAFYGDPQLEIASEAERYEKALELFKKSYETRKKPYALLYIANCNYELGKYDEAAATLQDVIKRFSGSKVVPLAYYKLAMSYMKKGESDNALKALTDLTSIKNSALQDMAMLESAKILESMGKNEEAKNKYKELSEKFPQSPFAEEAKMKLEVEKK